MLSPNEIIEIGFENLRLQESSRGPASLLATSRKRARVVWMKTTVGAAVCLVVGTVLAVAFKPVSALAALREAARRSAAQSFVHFRIENRDTYDHPSGLTPPSDLPVDIWRFPDHYVSRQGHVVKELFKDGRYLAYDDRFPDGFAWKYDAKRDRTWILDGTIGPEIVLRRPSPVKVEQRKTERGNESIYEWKSLDAQQNGITEHIYVNQATNLISFAEGDLKEPTGRRNHGICKVDYPDAPGMEREAAKFPSGLRFRTKRELLDDLDNRIVVPEQSQTVGGVRVTLYGVIAFPNGPDGIGIEAVIRGYTEPDCGSGHPLQIENTALLPTTRSDISQTYHDLTNAKFAHVRGFAHQLYIGVQSDALLSHAPRKLTLRVPVWRQVPPAGPAHRVQNQTVNFIGYATFTTSKIFYNVGNGYLPFYGYPPAGD